jgi:signal transduction histidine kinase
VAGTTALDRLLRTLLPAAAWRGQAAGTTAVQRTAVAAVSTFAGGIAHELNNPLSAVRRAASELVLAMGRLAASAEHWGGVGDPAERQAVRAAQRELTAAQCPGGTPDALAAAGNEQRLQGWLAAHGVADPAQLAGLLADRGHTVDWLVALAGRLRGQALAPALDYLSHAVLVHSLGTDLDGASQRMTDIVGTVRQYARLDRAPMQPVELAADLDATLAILRHRMTGMDVHRDYATDLPVLLGYPAELNEVWTNVIDNAVAATGGRGRLRIATYRDGSGVAVEIGDDGVGIPADALPRIFEPYFTTKNAGDGTGLGLYLSHLIVTERHGGSIGVESRPGDTRFLIRLPPRPERPAGGRQGVIGAIVRGETRVTHRRRTA